MNSDNMRKNNDEIKSEKNIQKHTQTIRSLLCVCLLIELMHRKTKYASNSWMGWESESKTELRVDLGWNGEHRTHITSNKSKK